MSNSKTLNARFQLKYDSYQNWKDKNPTLLAGELAVAKLVDDVTIPVNEQKSAPVLFKVGPGAFNDLPWASGLAADVYGWAKAQTVIVEDKLLKFVDVDAEGKVTQTRFAVSFADFATTAEMEEAIKDFVTDDELTEILKNYYTKDEVTELFKNYYTKAEVDEFIESINGTIDAIDTGVMSVEGKDAIVATGDDAVEVTLKIAEGEGRVGNVTLTQNADGLKAEYDLATELYTYGISKDAEGKTDAYFNSLLGGAASFDTLAVATSATINNEAIATQKYVGEQIGAAVEDLAVKNVTDTAVDKQFVTAIRLDTDGNVVATHEAIDGDDIADALDTYGITETGIETTNILARGTLGVYGETTFSGAVKKVETIDGMSSVYEVATERFATAAATTAQTAAEATAAADATAKANTAEANAKAYVDSEDIFETDMNTINALGGIGANVNLNGLTTHEVLKKLLYPYVDASVGNATASPNNGGTFEKGSTKTISSVSITVTKKSEPITSVALYDGSTEIETKTDVASGGTITFSNVNKSVTANGGKLTVKVTYPDAAGAAKTVSKETGAFTFISPYWYGVCGAADEIDAELVLGLTKDLTAKGTKTYSYTTEAQRMVIAYPSSYGKIKLVKDGNGLDNTGAFGQPVTVSVTSALGVTEEYYVYANGVTSGSAKMTFSY